jgi:hypothetical protein
MEGPFCSLNFRASLLSSSGRKNFDDFKSQKVGGRSYESLNRNQRIF